MRAVTIPTKGYGRGRKCAQCRRVLKAGECGLVHRITSARYYTDELWFHRSCMEILLGAAPLNSDDYDTEFDRLRAAAESGDLFA